jgi:hypothetical protein
MQHARPNTILARLRAFALIVAVPTTLATGCCGPAVAEDSKDTAAYAVEVSDVTAKVGEPAVMHATLRIRDGYRILNAYNNRVIELSSFDDGVAFERRMVPATVQEGALVFAVGLRATKPGKHPINGFFRVGYIRGTEEMAMVSLRLIGNVIGTE